MQHTVRTNIYDVNVVFKKKEITRDGYTLKYRLYIPTNYDCGEKYPLMVFLHGAGERGDDNEAQLKNGLQLMFNDITSPVYDSVIIVPQCTEGEQWVNAAWADYTYSVAATPESRALEMVCAAIDEVRDFCNIDDDRIYITGLSMGGFGTWDMLSRHGSKFAAGMPICGGGDVRYARLLKRIPIRTFHGSADDAVPVRATRAMYAAIKREGGENINYTEFEGCGHNVWDMVYSNRENIDWLYSQNRKDRREAAERRAKMQKYATYGGIGVLAAAAVLILSGKKKRKK